MADWGAPSAMTAMTAPASTVVEIRLMNMGVPFPVTVGPIRACAVPRVAWGSAQRRLQKVDNGGRCYESRCVLRHSAAARQRQMISEFHGAVFDCVRCVKVRLLELVVGGS